MSCTLDMACAKARYNQLAEKSDGHDGAPASTYDERGRTSEKDCPKCKTYLEELKVREIQMRNMVDEKHKFAEEINELNEHNHTVQMASEKLTRKMANVLENSEKLERLDDEFANSKLSGRFDSDIKKLWEDLNEAIVDDDQDISEIHRLQTVSDIMKDVYERCKARADRHIRQFCFLEKSEQLPDLMENSEYAIILKWRRINGQKESTLADVRKDITSEVLDALSSRTLNKKSSEKSKTLLTKFIEELAECCWLIAISKPSLCLNFEVVGQKYKNLENRFVAIATEDNITSSDHPEGSVHMVVWPSVELKERQTGYLLKGEVIVVSEKNPN
ncbi:uncharacterized protein LOC128216911 isoform X2 [Mya arenaria]|uniref:uncharacterized protein LOC128216911 isoform X2 n=1 Tax=Mya arenaria TaxID=6604 RepID=UPI0022E3D708|nr:uncharacterized protein LOC128216911 isoform X2 [Mya arenaria]